MMRRSDRCVIAGVVVVVVVRVGVWMVPQRCHGRFQLKARAGFVMRRTRVMVMGMMVAKAAAPAAGCVDGARRHGPGCGALLLLLQGCHAMLLGRGGRWRHKLLLLLQRVRHSTVGAATSPCGRSH